MTQEAYVYKIDKGWDRYYDYRNDLFWCAGHGCDDYRDFDPEKESYLDNLRQHTKNLKRMIFYKTRNNL